MNEYHKIQTVYLRDPETKFKRLIIGQYALPEFEYLAFNKWTFTEKVDGTNIRVMLPQYHEDGKQYGIAYGGRTDAAQIPATLISALDGMFRTDVQRAKLAEMFPDGACLYGEGYGAKIQKVGASYLPYQGFVLFDVRVGDVWLERHNVEDVAAKLGLTIAPVVGHGTLPEMVAMAREGIWSSLAVSPLQAEGIVARPTCELITRRGHRIITKIKYADFDRADAGGEV